MGRKIWREKTHLRAHLGQNFKNIIISSNVSLKLLWMVIFSLNKFEFAQRSIKCFAQNTIYNRNELLKHLVEKKVRIPKPSKSKKSLLRLPPPQKLHKLEETKTWSLWSTSSPLSRSILTVLYSPLTAALCRGPLDAWLKTYRVTRQ